MSLAEQIWKCVKLFSPTPQKIPHLELLCYFLRKWRPIALKQAVNLFKSPKCVDTVQFLRRAYLRMNDHNPIKATKDQNSKMSWQLNMTCCYGTAAEQ